MEGVLIFPLPIHIKSLVPPTVGAIYLHHTSEISVLYVSFLLASGELLMTFISKCFFIAFLRELFSETLSRYRGLAWLWDGL